MKLVPLFCLALLLVIGPVAHGQESGYPNCTEEEYLVTLDTLMDLSVLEILDASPSKSMDALVNFTANRIESRESRIVPVALCAQAIRLLRQDYLADDTFGEMALSRIGMPDEMNPYLLRLPSSEVRRQQHLQEVSGVETSTGPAPTDRALPVCSFRQNFTLDSLATNFDVTLSNASTLDGSDKWIEAADKILQWRVENLSSIPECLEAIEFGILLTKAATDAAALFVFRHAGVADERNPYITTVDEASEKLRFWRDKISLTRPENSGATVLIVGPASELPPCNSVEIAYVYSTFLDKVQDVVEIGQDFKSPTVMIDYAESHIDLRSDTLSRFPPCAELFEIGWLSQEYLDANAGYVSHHIFGFSREGNPFAARLIEASDAFLTWHAETSQYLRDFDGIVGPAPDERVVAACRPGEIASMLGFLIPEFRAFVRAGLTIESISDNSALIEQSFILRDRLWSTLPRCQEALEIGLLMRKILGDWLSMQAVHNILGREDNRYAAQVQGDLDRFLEMNDSFANPAEGASQSVVSPPPLISPERSTVLPACTDSEQVDAQTIVSDALYELHDTSDQIKDIEDLLAWSRKAVQKREDYISSIRLCAENLEYVWLNTQFLSDFASWYGMILDGKSRDEIPFTWYSSAYLRRIIVWEDRVKEINRSDSSNDDRPTVSSEVSSCSNADLVFLVSEIVPRFESFADLALSVRSKADFHVLADNLIIYREKLRAGLPRCVEALEIGLAMLKTAGDFVSMFALDYAGADPEDIPYLEHIEMNTDLITARNNEFVESLGLDETVGETETTETYYVTANPYANIRACGSTNCEIVATAQYGEALAVVDDSADWYEIRLDDGQAAFIAGFLMSKTPPES